MAPNDLKKNKVSTELPAGQRVGGVQREAVRLIDARDTSFHAEGRMIFNFFLYLFCKS